MQAIARRSSQQIGQSLFPSFDPKSVAFIFILLLDHLSSIFFAFFYNSSLPFHPFYHTSPPFSPLSASFFEISLWFTATLPLLFFFAVSSPLAVYLVIFSCFSPSLFSVCDDPSFLFFFPSDFPPQRTLFSPSLLHFWPVTGLIRDFDAETWKSSIETNRLRRATVCGGIDVCVCNTNEIK